MASKQSSVLTTHIGEELEKVSIPLSGGGDKDQQRVSG